MSASRATRRRPLALAARVGADRFLARAVGSRPELVADFHRGPGETLDAWLRHVARAQGPLSPRNVATPGRGHGSAPLSSPGALGRHLRDSATKHPTAQDPESKDDTP